MRKRMAMLWLIVLAEVPTTYHAIQLGSLITLPPSAASCGVYLDNHYSQTFDPLALKAHGCELPICTK